MKIKICGITHLEDALKAVELGADALGFVFYPPSPRYIKPHLAKEIISDLPPLVHKVGVFAGCLPQEVEGVFQEAGLSLAQLHDETLWGHEYAIPTLKAFRIASKEELLRAQKEGYCLVDSFVESFGGEGKRLELSWFEGVDCSKMILAGGLRSENLEEIRSLGFYGVDVSSGVEGAPGKKDFAKMERFIRHVQSL